MSKYFKHHEFTCKCGCDLNMTQPLLLDLLEHLRIEVQEPIFINSATRCIAHNAAVGGSPRSQHLLGAAADIRCEVHTPKELYDMLDKAFPSSLGLGLYENFVHIDVRQGRARW